MMSAAQESRGAGREGFEAGTSMDDLKNYTSTNTMIEDGVSLLDALDQLGFVQNRSTSRGLGVGLVSATGFGAFYVFGKMKLIQEGSMGLTLRNGRPIILRPGRYVLLSPLHSFVQQRSINEELIQFGPLTIVTIKKGQLGVSWKNGETIILEPGRHILVAPHTYQGAKDIGSPYVELGPIKRMIVNEGQVGIAYDTGKLEVLLPGLHVRTSPTFKFQEFVSVQEQVRRLEPLKVNTNDGITIMVHVIITYRFDDPVRAFRDVRNVNEALFEKAEALVTSIFLHHALDEIAPTLPSSKNEEPEIPGFGSDNDDDESDDDDEKPSDHAARPKKKKAVKFSHKGKGKGKEPLVAPRLFSDVVREAFMAELKDYVATWGVVLMDMNIEKLEFQDTALRTLLTERAANRVQTASNRANISAQAQTGIQKAQGHAQEARIKADAELYTAEQRAKAARLQADTELAKQLAIMRATREIVEAAGDKTTFIPWNMQVNLREGAATSDHGFDLLPPPAVGARGGRSG